METLNQGVGVLQATEYDITTQRSNLTTPPRREISIIDGVDVAYRPVSTNSKGPFVFIISPQGDKYIDLPSMRLWFEAKVTKADDTAITDADLVAPINLIGQTLFDTINIKIGGQDISTLTNNNVAHKSYVETLLSYSNIAMKSHLQCSGWYKDTPGQFNTTTDVNGGFAKRKQLVAKSKSFQMCSPIFCDFTQIQDLFPPNVQVQIILQRNIDKVILMTGNEDTEYKLEIQDMKLYARHITLHPSAHIQNMQHWATKPIVLPFTKTIITSRSFPPGGSNVTINNLFDGTIPKHLVFFMVANENLSDFKKNPFTFDHFNVTEIFLKVNGRQYPSDPYRINIKDKKYLRVYRDLFDNVGISYDNRGLAITFDDFVSGCFFFVFDLSPDQCNGFHNHLKTDGNIEVEVQFGTPLTKTVQLFSLASFDAYLGINNDSSCTVTY